MFGKSHSSGKPTQCFPLKTHDMLHSLTRMAYDIIAQTLCKVLSVPLLFHTHTHNHTHNHSHTHTHTHTHTQTHTHTKTHTHKHKLTLIQIHSHTYSHTHV